MTVEECYKVFMWKSLCKYEGSGQQMVKFSISYDSHLAALL